MIQLQYRGGIYDWSHEMRLLEVVRFLVKNGADKNAKNEAGEIPFRLAACEGHLYLVQYFVEEVGVDLDLGGSLLDFVESLKKEKKSILEKRILFDF